MYKLYIWKTPKGNYYHKLCKGSYKYNHVGDVNQYDHKLIHIVNLSDFIDNKHHKVNYRKMLINDTIHLLEKLK